MIFYKNCEIYTILISSILKILKFNVLFLLIAAKNNYNPFFLIYDCLAFPLEKLGFYDLT